MFLSRSILYGTVVKSTSSSSSSITTAIINHNNTSIVIRNKNTQKHVVLQQSQQQYMKLLKYPQPQRYYYKYQVLYIQNRYATTNTTTATATTVISSSSSLSLIQTMSNLSTTNTLSASSRKRKDNTVDQHSNVTPPDVNLVWKYTTSSSVYPHDSTNNDNDNNNNINNNQPKVQHMIQISLQPIPTSNNDDAITSNQKNDHPFVASSTEIPIKDDITSNSNSGVVVDTCHNDDTSHHTIIPESVLIYERQIRKAQHAKKTSQSISDDDLHVIYVDEYIVVVDKPPGVLTVPGLNNHISLLDLVYKKYGTTTVIDPTHMIVHRLDMDTSGIVLFARTLSVAKQLHTTFRNRTNISKQYECLVMGHLPVPHFCNSNQKQKQQQQQYEQDASTIDTGTSNGNDNHNSNNNHIQIKIDLPIQRDHIHPPFMRISTPKSEKAAMECVDQLQLHGWKKIIRKSPKQSETIITQIIQYGTMNVVTGDNLDEIIVLPYTRLRLEPITGRTHQLRVHCAAIGYPIVGDPTYGLYGEAALFGGLEDLKSTLICNDHDIDTTMSESTPHTTSTVTTIPEGNVDTITMIPRCSLDIMKDWTRYYPPNVKPMCLHATLLKLQHPVTGEVCHWDVPPKFETS